MNLNQIINKKIIKKKEIGIQKPNNQNAEYLDLGKPPQDMNKKYSDAI